MSLFDAHVESFGNNTTCEYDVTSDGKRFLINATGGSGAASPPLTVVTNWNAVIEEITQEASRRGGLTRK